ncbi:MAG TPA: hypothetical protein DDZ89_06120, partial [Clostridiales bacterium]|nr:hypothetical protein [Clostridiales bacterium]
PQRTEINQIELVQLMTIDKCEKTGQIEVSVISKVGKNSGGTGDSDKETINAISGVGHTVFEAVRKLKSHSDKMIYFSHVEYFIIGEGAAADSFEKYFDVISRDPELRLTPKVYIAKGCMAKDLVFDTVSPEKYIIDRLKTMGDDEKVLGVTSEVSIIEVMNMLVTPNVATVIPALERKEIHDEKSSTKLPEYDVVTAGYAMIKNFKLCGYIDSSLSRGHNFIVGKLSSTPISVKDFTGQYVALELISAKTKVKGHFKGKRLTGVTIETLVYSNVEEQHSSANIFTEESVVDLGDKQAKIIAEEMEKVIELSQEIEIDCIELGKRIRMRYPFKWDDIEKDWGEIYPQLDIKVDVTTNVIRTYEINQPIGYEMD